MAHNLPLIKPVIVKVLGNRQLSSDWVYEFKYDGFRAQLHIQGEKAFFLSKTGKVLKRFESLAERIRDILKGVDSLILDGEIVWLDETGKSNFRKILRHSTIPTYAAFDILYFNEVVVAKVPYHKRKELLKKLIGNKLSMHYVDYWDKDRQTIEIFVKQQGLEGIVAKRKNDSYSSGTVWYKIKNKNYNHLGGVEKYSKKHQHKLVSKQGR